ncbi:F-box family protein [Rhynchospora pubera]|uniref:F-box family protein n=1 Tax=Rhynchospora pubera TaxID=906938 RepID=A0AAV8ETQ2_9POAL|nr:F-box family protein [Rhynchospora pubera]
MVDWSGLTTDVLEHISSFLPFPDHYRFGAVCKNWRSVSKLRRYPPAPQLPWLVLDEESETKKRKFYSLSEAKHHSIEIPELHGRYICGSSYGWLFAIDIKITCILINPFTRDCYDLPPIPAYNRDVDFTTLIEDVPSDYIEEPRNFTLKEMQTRSVFKAILSHDPKERPDFTVMILFGEINTPAFWRPGDSSWTMVDGPKCRFEDVLYFKEKFFVITAMNVLHVVDFQLAGPKLKEIGLEIGKDGYPQQCYLMDFNGNLFFVERFCEYVQEVDKELDLTVGFNVLELNLEMKYFCEWDDIDDYVMFLGRNSTIFVYSGHSPNCKKNSIYFTNVTDGFYGCYDLGIFDMTDEKISKFYSNEVFPRVGAPIWLSPNPW